MASSESIRRAQVQKRPKSQQYCPNHSRSNVQFVCQNEGCNEELACIQCVTDTHKGHPLEDVTKYASDKRHYLEGKLQQLKNDSQLTNAETMIKNINEMTAGNQENFSERQAVIRQKSKQLQGEINTISEKLITLCKDSMESNERKLKQHKKCLEKLIAAYKEQMYVNENVCQNGSDLDVIYTYRSSTLHLPTNLQIPKSPEMKDLQKYDISEVADISTNLHHMMGLSEALGGSSECHTSFQVLGESEGNIKYICAIMDQVLVWFWNSRKVTIYNKHGISTHTIKLQTMWDNMTLQDSSESEDLYDESDEEDDLVTRCKIQVEDDTEIVDVCFSSLDTSLWYCCSDNTVWQRKNDGLCSVRFNTEQRPTTLCVCEPGHIAVGTIDCNVILFSQTGEQLLNSASVLEWCPRKITHSSRTGHFAVLKSNANVNILSQDLRNRHMFETKKQLEGCDKEPQYGSEGICYDSMGNLFIADKRNQVILMLDKDGTFLKTIPQESDDLYPETLSSINEGSLWVAYRKESLHIIEIVTYI